MIAEARRWIQTPVIHQHAIRGFGVDCWNLARAVGETCKVLKISPKKWAPFEAYGEHPSPRLTLAACEAFFLPVPDGAQLPGDIALIAWRPNIPQHFAILSENYGRPYIIHAWGDAPGKDPRGKVVEHGLTGEWPPKVHSWWRYPGLKDVPWLSSS